MRKQNSLLAAHKAQGKFSTSPRKYEVTFEKSLIPPPKRNMVETRSNSVLRKLAQLTPMHSNLQIEEVAGI